MSLPPFADALKLLDKERRPKLIPDPTPTPTPSADDEDEDPEEEGGGGRDILGEMEIAARIMITGGDEREDARMTRADRLLIRNAIFLAAKTVREQGRDQVLTEDVVAALQQIATDQTLPEHRRNRALEMGDGMALFCSGLAGHFFNRPGRHWPEADVTLLEMGILAREGYEDQLTVAYLSMMSHINDLVERHQSDARPTLVVTDEGHIITTNPLLARYVVKITKMWRKLGAWFWIATQNLEDFPDASRKMLNMMEWWLCLVMPKEEVEQIARFKDLTDEQRSLLLSARKEPGKYVEGVVLADNLEALFRNVPPPLSLALAMTEKHEKAERAAIMRERGCSELEAVQVVAERIAARAGCVAQPAEQETRRPVERVSGSRVPWQAARMARTVLSRSRVFHARRLPLRCRASCTPRCLVPVAWEAALRRLPMAGDRSGSRCSPRRIFRSERAAAGRPACGLGGGRGLRARRHRQARGRRCPTSCRPSRKPRGARPWRAWVEWTGMDQESDAAQRAASGLLKAAEYGIDRYPAVVFDGDAVVYGVTDLDEALRHYREWQGRAPR